VAGLPGRRTLLGLHPMHAEEQQQQQAWGSGVSPPPPQHSMHSVQGASTSERSTSVPRLSALARLVAGGQQPQHAQHAQQGTASLGLPSVSVARGGGGDLLIRTPGLSSGMVGVAAASNSTAAQMRSRSREAASEVAPPLGPLLCTLSSQHSMHPSQEGEEGCLSACVCRVCVWGGGGQGVHAHHLFCVRMACEAEEVGKGRASTSTQPPVL
jgi:hypothetical protein